MAQIEHEQETNGTVAGQITKIISEAKDASPTFLVYAFALMIAGGGVAGMWHIATRLTDTIQICVTGPEARNAVPD